VQAALQAFAKHWKHHAWKQQGGSDGTA
jgi:hypothetical protein